MNSNGWPMDGLGYRGYTRNGEWMPDAMSGMPRIHGLGGRKGGMSETMLSQEFLNAYILKRLRLWDDHNHPDRRCPVMANDEEMDRLNVSQSD